MSCRSCLCSLLTGVSVGIGIGVLFAPKEGKETRECLKNNLRKMKSKMAEIDPEDVKKYVEKNIKKLKKEIDSLSLEDVSAMAKKKAKEISKKIDDLVSYVKEKGTPILEDAVYEVKEMADDVIDSMENN